jgi:fibronectin-binding autotransporter adhesin
MNSTPTVQLLESRLSPATFTVTKLLDDGTAGTLRAALTAANAIPGADKIVFKLPAPAAHGENTILLTMGELTSKGNVTIAGPGAGKLIIDAQGNSRVFHIDDGSNTTDSPTTISGLSIIKGATGGNGGGVYSAESLTLNSVVISECSADVGGALEMLQGAAKTVAISNSLIAGNFASDVGGLDMRSLDTITVKKTVVTGNNASFSWGGLVALVNAAGTGIAVTGCTISNNSATFDAGMTLRSDATSPKVKTIVSGTVIADNSTTGASSAGGGVYLFGGNAIISGSTICNNSVVGYGGGLGAYLLSSLTISHSTIAGNRTTALISGQGGGGISIKGTGAATPVTITGCSITGNSSAYDGGGLLATKGIALTITGTTFSANRADAGGGGIYAVGSGANKVDLTIKGATFSNNLSELSGGGVFAEGDGQFAVSSTKVTGNVSASFGGGLYLSSSAATNGVVLSNLTVANNSAGAGFFGGGVLITSTPDFHIAGGAFFDNEAGAGGAIATTFSSGSILGVTVTGNNARVEGGGITQSSGGAVVVQAAKVSGNTSPTGPDFFGTFTYV